MPVKKTNKSITAVVEPNLDLNIIEEKLKDKSLKNAPKHKKIGYFSAIMLVIGSSVGAGIFIKNANILNNVQNALFYAVLSWAIAIVGILALVLALVEVCSGAGQANSQGIIGWVREFNSKFLYRSSKNFMAYIHTPLIYVMMPFYMIMVSQQAFGYEMPWWGALLITLGIGLYHIWFVGFFTKAANISNWIVSIIEFAPLLFACVSGFVLLGLNINANWWNSPNNWWNPHPSIPIINDVPQHFAEITLMFGVLNSIPAVFFSFDGFYNTAGIQTELKEPEKMPKILVIGVTVVAAFEILVSTSLLIGCSDGSLFGLSFVGSPYPSILIKILMVCVLIGMLSVITGNAVYAPRFYESLINHNEMPFFKNHKDKLNTHRPVIGTIVTQILFLVALTIIIVGGYWFWDIGGYTQMTSIDNISIYHNNSHMANILSFLDTVANWNALFAFAFVTIAIIGCLINRKTHKVKVTKSKFFIPSAIITILIVGCGVLFVFINSFGELGWQIYRLVTPDVANPSKMDMVGSIITIGMLFIFLIVMFIPAIVERNKHVHKHNSL